MYATADNVVWTEISEHFDRGEFQNPDGMDDDFLRWLLGVRKDAGVPFRVISDARDPDGNVGASQSAHKHRPCKAVDLQVMNNHERFEILRAAFAHGCKRIGIYPSSDVTTGKGGLHLDLETSLPQEVSWTGY